MNRGKDPTATRARRSTKWFVLPLATTMVATIGVDSYSIARTSAAGQTAQTKTVWDGIYSEAQAVRGKELYNTNCAGCHMEELQGEDLAPALKGEDFLVRWADAPVHDLFNRVATTMPAGAPGSLSPQAVIDIVTVIFKGNKFPVGSEEVKPDVALLKAITITKQAPAR